MMTDSNAVIKLLECPVCLEIIHVPIYQCFHGHLLCQTCIKGVRNCPICRDEMPAKPIRNLALEKMTENCEFDCRNSVHGCDKKLKQVEFKEHSLDCLFETRNFCRSLALYQTTMNTCEREIQKLDIVDHMKTYHSLKGVRGSKAEVVQTLETSTQSLMWVPVYFEVFDTVFFITGGYSHREEVAKWNCIVAGSCTAAKSFHVQMSLFTIVPKIRLTWEGPVLGMNRSANDTEKASFVVTKKSLTSFCQDSNPQKPKWKIQVIIKRISRSEDEAPPVPTKEPYPSLGSLSVAINDVQPSPMLASINDKSVATGVAFHNGVTCDECRTRNIVGTRYKCLQCVDYDLCEGCNNNRLHDHHLLLRIAHEVQRSRAYEFFRRLGNGMSHM